MSRQAEGSFKERVQKDLRELFGQDIEILATQERGRKGVADLIICLYGDSIRQELKVDGEKPTKLQQHKLDRHTRAGGLSFYSTPSTWPGQLATLKEKYARKKA